MFKEEQCSCMYFSSAVKALDFENYIVWSILGRINKKDTFLKVARNNLSCHV